MSSFQDFTNDLAPFVLQLGRQRVDVDTRLRVRGDAPLRSRRHRPASAAPTSPWSANALSVPSGIVLTVSGAASALMYRMSEAFGSLVPVLASSSRCGRAPALSARCYRGEAMKSQ